jgi:hypothetical protein
MGQPLDRRLPMGARGLTARAARYLAACDADDPVVVANRMIDRALRLQDAGRNDEADELLADAEALLEGEPS